MEISKRVPNTVRATELKREKVESAILRDIIAKKDRELRAAADRMSHLEAESAQIQASSDKVQHELAGELSQKNNEIRKLREKAAEDMTISRAFASNLEQQLGVVLAFKSGDRLMSTRDTASESTLGLACQPISTDRCPLSQTFKQQNSAVAPSKSCSRSPTSSLDILGH